MNVEGKTVVCIGTGPSLTRDQVRRALRRQFVPFGCNNAFMMCPEVALLYAVNLEWWDHYFATVSALQCELWTTNAVAARKYALHWINEKNAPGMSTDPAYIHHGHGGGYSIVSLAHAHGAKRVVLLGYDCRYAKDYNAFERYPGSSPRHFFGEYPESMQHWPSVQVKEGDHVELIELYRSIAKQGAIEVINATPGSAIDAFPRVPIERL